ncbi:signal peptidase I [Effusibacillus lacus]|uniref:Signal peptidase I n=1 Tax=Effusibacillus lacus TaxID=1348429 RepID=A0A292YED7_9BACL|nr:signal peptidase I [Effusibacillus lacus]TCS76060.1 signal peptidase I [Effusibacillus lacus]GAX91422.1 signal peptidase I [Effusibacillus lacus]
MSDRSSNETWEWIKALGLAVVLALGIHQFVFAQFLVDGESMMPTMEHRERLIVNKLIYRIHKPEYGDIIVFKYPADKSKDFIKRVIGLPGDTVEVKGGKVYRNGQELKEPYLGEPTNGTWGPEKVPEGKIFVMGDNRNNSKDSRDRTVGFIPYDLVVGRADLVFWPLNKFELFPFK